jgi:hypothetical protein
MLHFLRAEKIENAGFCVLKKLARRLVGLFFYAENVWRGGECRTLKERPNLELGGARINRRKESWRDCALTFSGRFLCDGQREEQVRRGDCL